MRILWISPAPSHPSDREDRAHIQEIGAALMQAGHDITFLLHSPEEPEETSWAALKGFWSELLVVPRYPQRARKSQGTRWGVDDWFGNDIEGALRLLISRTTYDVVWCGHIGLSKALSLFPTTTFKVLCCHRVMSEPGAIPYGSGGRELQPMPAAQEKLGLDRADLIVSVRPEDHSRLQAMTDRPVHSLSLPVPELARAQRSSGDRLRVGVLAEGNPAEAIALEAFVTALCRGPAPKRPITLVLGGQIAALNEVRWPEQLSIEKLDPAADPASFHEAVDVVAAIDPGQDPALFSLLMALGHRLPVVATDAVGRRVGASAPRHRLADPSAIAAAVRGLAEASSEIERARGESSALLDAYRARTGPELTMLLRSIAVASAQQLAPKRILLVTDIPFWAGGLGSHMRIRHLVTELRQHGLVRVFFFGSVSPLRAQELRECGLEDVVVSYKAYESPRKPGSPRSGFPRVPGLESRRHDAFFDSLAAYLQTQPPFDSAIFEYLWMGYLADALPSSTLRILDTHDFMSMREYRFASSHEKPSISITLKEELSILERMDVVLAIQFEEARAMARHLRRALVLCCPYGVATNAPPDSVEPTRSTLVLGFVAAESVANRAAIQWFIDNVMPCLEAIDVRLNVYGGVCAKIRDVPHTVGMRGFVDDVDDIYRECDVMINPVIHGGGIKIKSIEALSRGKPLIASPEGAVGIAEPERSGVVVVRSRAEFATAVIDLALRRDLLTRLGADARQAARRQFSPAAAYGPLVQLLEQC